MKYNPFRGLCHEELVLAYLQYSDDEDNEAVSLVAVAYDEDTYIDLTEFNIGTSDYP
tara:strand:+ start:600 stop:770 length:171 start_codon:yes stop_codon:yes gene_type:complete